MTIEELQAELIERMEQIRRWRAVAAEYFAALQRIADLCTLPGDRFSVQSMQKIASDAIKRTADNGAT